MKAYAIILAAALAATPALAQQAQAPKCPDFSLQLAEGIQATTDRDNWAGQAQALRAQLANAQKQIDDDAAKIKADDALIANLRGEPKKEEPKP